MDEKTYDILLEKCYSELPKDLEKNKRFELPKFSGNITKSKTIITNFSNVCEILNRTKDFLMKYLNKELGVRSEIDSKNNLILFSRFSSKILNETLEKFFEQKVKCEKCLSPDTILDKGIIKCQACGHVRKI